MFNHYIKIAFRYLLKNMKFSFINIAGLSIGILCCLYIILFVQDQYSFDKHLSDAKDIFRVTSSLRLPGEKVNDMATSSPPVAPALKNDFGEVLDFTRVIPTGMVGIAQHLLRYNDKSFYETNAVYVDSTFFDLFTYKFIEGNASEVLKEPYSIVLLKPTADKLFDKSDPIGKTIEIDNSFGKQKFKVTGVVDESLGKSCIHANMFITMNSGDFGNFIRNNDTWSGNNFVQSYIKLVPNSNAALLEKKLPAFLKKYAQSQLKSAGMEKELHLQPVTSIHTTKGYDAEMDKTVSPSFLYILLSIAALILVVACINFMNLTTARASKRAKEVGVRKVIGAERMDLVKQFLGESFLLSLMGVIVALPLLWLVLPYLNRMTRSDIHFSSLIDYRFFLFLVCLIVITGLVAGSYPSFYLSAFRAIKVIKGDFSNHVSAAGIRRSLVVFQFVLSTVLISGIIIIYYQLNYINTKDLGFEKDQKLIFSFHTEETKREMQSFIDDLRSLSEVKNVSKSDSYLGQPGFHDVSLYPIAGSMANSIGAQYISDDEYFVRATGIKLISGRDFRSFDSSRILVNESFIKRLGLKPETAPGTRLHTQGNELLEIVGVMKDFNYNSLHEDVKPFMLVYDQNNSDFSDIILNVNSRNYKILLGNLESFWHKDIPNTPFEYAFLDQEVQKQYETETTLANIINSFTLVAIFVSCLGLFGLVAFSAEQRTKELGIRKVLGASIAGLTTLLSKDFLKLVTIAILIAIPISLWVMNKWLQQFAYRIEIKWWMFAFAGLLAIFIAMCTVSFQAVKAALSNPIKSLRSE